jgi:hypothetical protein
MAVDVSGISAAFEDLLHIDLPVAPGDPHTHEAISAQDVGPVGRRSQQRSHHRTAVPSAAGVLSEAAPAGHLPPQPRVVPHSPSGPRQGAGVETPHIDQLAVPAELGSPGPRSPGVDLPHEAAFDALESKPLAARISLQVRIGLNKSGQHHPQKRGRKDPRERAGARAAHNGRTPLTSGRGKL